MRIGLCMVIKDEIRVIGRCLENIHDLFDDITIVDTGSTDGTIELLQNRFGIQPVIWSEAIKDNPNISWEPAARNLSLEHSNADWVLVLDADEVITRHDVLLLKNLTPACNGYFINWRNTRADATYDDYKLAFFERQKVRYHGLIHCNPQPSFRTNGLYAECLAGACIHHMQEAGRPHRSNKIDSLRNLVNEHPEHNRYKWFLGYTHYQENNHDLAARYLESVAPAPSEIYPVECINAHVVLACIYAQKKMHIECLNAISKARSIFEKHREDFELRANEWVDTWFKSASHHIEAGDLSNIKCPEFAC